MNITKGFMRFFALPVVLSTAALFACSQGPKTGAPASFVTFFTGSATIQRGSGPMAPVQLKDQVLDGDIIRTGEKSSVIVQSTDGLVLRIEQKAEVAISSFNAVVKREISLSKGKVLSSVAKLKKGSEYRVVTPTAVASVRGTEFLTEFTGKSSIIAVGKGSVSVKKTTGAVPEKVVEKGTTAVIAEQIQQVQVRTSTRVETLELSKFEKTPVVQDVEKKKPEEIKTLFQETGKRDERINFEIKQESGLTFNEMKEAYKRIDVITLFNGRVIKGIIVSRGDIYRIITETGPVEVKAKDVQRTDVR